MVHQPSDRDALRDACIAAGLIDTVSPADVRRPIALLQASGRADRHRYDDRLTVGQTQSQ
ncbi:hypothetical protein JOE11_002672 [Robbsia andropogonis]